MTSEDLDRLKGLCGVYNKDFLEGYKVMGYWSRRSVAFLVQDSTKRSGYKQAGRACLITSMDLSALHKP